MFVNYMYNYIPIHRMLISHFTFPIPYSSSNTFGSVSELVTVVLSATLISTLLTQAPDKSIHRHSYVAHTHTMLLILSLL